MGDDPAHRAEAQATLGKFGRLTKVRDGLKTFNDQEKETLKKRADEQVKTEGGWRSRCWRLARAWRSCFRP